MLTRLGKCSSLAVIHCQNRQQNNVHETVEKTVRRGYKSLRLQYSAHIHTWTSRTQSAALNVCTAFLPLVSYSKEKRCITHSCITVRTIHMYTCPSPYTTVQKYITSVHCARNEHIHLQAMCATVTMAGCIQIFSLWSLGSH